MDGTIPLTRKALKSGEQYNWKYNPETPLTYLGTDHTGRWHQFCLAGDGEKIESGKVWCEVLDQDLPLLEKSAGNETSVHKPQQGTSP